MTWELQPLSFTLLYQHTSSHQHTIKPFICHLKLLSKLFYFFKIQVYQKNHLHLLPVHCGSHSVAPAASTWLSGCLKITHETLKLQWFLLLLCSFISSTVEVFTTFSLKFSVPAACYWVLFTTAGCVKCFPFLPFFHLAQGPTRNNAPYSSLPVADPVCAWRFPLCAIFPISLWAENVLSHLYSHLVPTWSTFDAFFIDSMILYTFSI